MTIDQLIKQWSDYVLNYAGYEEASAYEQCMGDIDQQARTAWKPVSEPPTEADGDERGDVLVLDEGKPERLDWWLVEGFYEDGGMSDSAQWARIRDVLLMPEGE